MHWASQYIGKPYSSGGRGPLAFDCWGLLFWIYTHHYGIDLPSFPGINSEDSTAVGRIMHAEEQKARKGQSWGDWKRIDEPSDGCVALMGGMEVLSHVGIYFDLPGGGRILHARPGMGVVAQRPLEIQATFKFHQLRFYQNVNFHHCTKPA